MQEYVTDAIILRKDPRGDLDGRYTLFTKRFGKIAGRATSSRKITSKLAPHLEPGFVTKVRFVEAKGTQIIDALKSARLAIAIADLHALERIMPEAEPEPLLWDLLQSAAFSWRPALAILGWDPEHAACTNCAGDNAEYFYIPRQEFYCAQCASKLGRNTISLMIHAV